METMGEAIYVFDETAGKEVPKCRLLFSFAYGWESEFYSKKKVCGFESLKEAEERDGRSGGRRR